MSSNINIPYQAPIIQGDVILKKIAKLPSTATLLQLDVKVLQESETTGHHHQFDTTSNVDLYQIPIEAIPGIATLTDNKGKIIVVHEPSYLFHGLLTGDHKPAARGTGDHDSILVPPGTYVVDIVREYDYDFYETRRVVD